MCLIGILIFVKPNGRRLPDVDIDAFNGLARFVDHGDIGKERRTGGRTTHNRATVIRAWRIHPPERPKKRRVGFRRAIIAIVQKADEGRKTKRIRHQDAFVMAVIRRLPDAVQEVDASVELGFGQANFARKIMQMRHK